MSIICPNCNRSNNFDGMCGYCDKTYHQMLVEANAQIKEMKEAFESIFYNSLWSIERGYDGETDVDLAQSSAYTAENYIDMQHLKSIDYCRARGCFGQLVRHSDGHVECAGCTTRYIYHEDVKEIHPEGEECEFCNG